MGSKANRKKEESTKSEQLNLGEPKVTRALMDWDNDWSGNATFFTTFGGATWSTNGDHTVSPQQCGSIRETFATKVTGELQPEWSDCSINATFNTNQTEEISTGGVPSVTQGIHNIQMIAGTSAPMNPTANSTQQQPGQTATQASALSSPTRRVRRRRTVPRLRRTSPPSQRRTNLISTADKLRLEEQRSELERRIPLEQWEKD